ncbi:hypothetical protein V6U81_15410 [Micromonospora sp. CPCC 205711]|uniref:hypothetical protein n=1 Tax=Micromonospora sp. CPCC 205547 TaxID=3122400 RepID=UPI002FF3ABF3
MAEPDRRHGATAGEQRPEPVVEVSGETVDEPRPSWPRGARLLAAAAVLVVGLGAVAVVATLANPDRLGVAFSGGRGGLPSDTVGAEPGGAGAAEPAAERIGTAPLAGRRRATFELVDGVTAVRLRTEDLGDELYRISAPVDSGVLPRPEVLGDRVQLRVEKSDRPGRDAVDVVLNSRLVWRLRLVGGATEHLLDLTGTRLAGVELIGGATRVDLRLPEVTGTLTVRMSGGVNQFAVRAPGSPPVRIRAASGAGGITLYGDRREGVAAGQLISSPNWDRSVARIYLDLVAGANTVTVAGD